tara:strand:+ start:292 stop:534 length:243 start_codon:yes stop_codon:yes gene_type:complete
MVGKTIDQVDYKISEHEAICEERYKQLIYKIDLMANEQKLQRDDIIDLMANMNRGWGFISAIGVIGIVIGIIFTVIRLLR